MFGKILTFLDILGAGNTYAFTFASGEWFFLHTTATIQSQLSDRMANLGQIISVSRGQFSDHYVVTALSISNESLDSWLSAFDVSWRDMGYNSITFITSEEGIISSQPGGVSELLSSVGSTVGSVSELLSSVGSTVGSTIGSTIGSIVKPIFGYVLIGIAVYAGVKMLPQLMMKRRRW